jgi:hypothetical protein
MQPVAVVVMRGAVNELACGGAARPSRVFPSGNAEQSLGRLPVLSTPEVQTCPCLHELALVK